MFGPGSIDDAVKELTDGKGVEEITETGAVLSHQGTRFFLDRN